MPTAYNMGVLLSSSAVIDKTPRSLIISLSSLYLAVSRKSAKFVLLSAEVVCLYTQAFEVRILIFLFVVDRVMGLSRNRICTHISPHADSRSCEEWLQATTCRQSIKNQASL